MARPVTLPRGIDPGVHVQLAELANRQQGVVRREQLHVVGLSRHVVASMLDASRWQALGQTVVVMHNGPLLHEQELWAAVLNAGPLAALAARTAATEYGLTTWEPDCIEIVVARGRLVPPGLALAVKVHESRRFTATDIHTARAIPMVRVERALIDAAVWSTRARTACGVLAAGVQQRLTTPARLMAELSVAGKVRHRHLLAAALADIEGGAQAMSEIDFLRFCRRNRLPRPSLQEVRRDASGRRRYLDATFRLAGGRVVRVEIDGALHLVVRTYWDDMYRGNELAIGSETVLRLPSYVIHANDAAALDQLRRALGLSVAQRPMTG